MYHRVLLAGLVLLATGIGVQADVHRNDEHQFEANFPGKLERIDKIIKDGPHVVGGLSRQNGYLFAVGVSFLEGQEVEADHLSDFAKAFVESMMATRKNASIVKEEDQKLSENTPQGTGFLVKHDSGWLFGWATIENGKGYFVFVEGRSEDALKADVVKNFQKSVKIRGGVK